MNKFTSLLFILFIFVTGPVWAEDATKYTCPMHPHYVADSMGACPICGMDLVPMEAEEDHTEHGHNSENPEQKGDRVVISIAPETIQNMGVRTEKVMLSEFGSHIRSYGIVAENKRNTHNISGRVAGWVETLKIKAVGDEVKKGDLIFTLFSPDLVSAQGDYLAALASGISGRINASNARLQSLGLSPSAIKQIRSKRQKLNNIPFYASHNGVVSKLMVSEGSYIKPGMEIASFVDYSSIWIEVNIAEKDMQFLNAASKATVTFPNLGITRHADIDYIYPTVDNASRTGKIRLVLDNKDGALKPGAYADVVFETNSKERLSVPSEAILKSSQGDFVVVALGDGKFQPQKVHSGVRSQGRTEILHGLEAEQEVVVSSQFLIDSESSLKEAFRKMGPPQKAGGGHANH